MELESVAAKKVCEEFGIICAYKQFLLAQIMVADQNGIKNTLRNKLIKEAEEANDPTLCEAIKFFLEYSESYLD